MTPETFRHIRSNILNLTQSALAVKMGVSRGTIVRYEGGQINIPEMAVILILKLAADA